MDSAEARRETPGTTSVNDKKAQAATEQLKREGNDEASLGKALASAREARGVSREDAAKETRIPGHYLAMMESNDYSKISDQLYMLPFLRRYAQFLELDPEESAMRFVREVQRADNSPSPARLAEPLDDLHRHKRRSRTGAIVVIALIGMIAAAYVAESRHREPAASSSTAVTQALPAAPIGPAMNKP